jgi:hypothetical protein
MDAPRYVIWLAGGDQPLVKTARDTFGEVVALCKENDGWAEHCWVHKASGLLLRAYHRIAGEWVLCK